MPNSSRKHGVRSAADRSQDDAPTQVWISVPGRAQQAARRERVTRKRPSSWQRLFLAWSLITFSLLSVSVAGGLVWLYRSDRIIPGVRVGLTDADVGGLPRSAARQALERHWQQTRIALVGGGAARIAGPDELGLSLDARATVEAAYRRGRSPQMLIDWLTTGESVVQPVWQVDEATTLSFLDSLAPEVVLKPVDAGVAIVAGQAQATPAIPGSRLDAEATRQWLVAHGDQVIRVGRLNLIMQPVEPAVTSVQSLIDEINEMLALSLTIEGYDPVSDEHLAWTLDPGQWGEWLTAVPDPDHSGGVTWTFDEARAAQYLSTQLPGLGQSRRLDATVVTEALASAIDRKETQVPARIYHQSRQHIIQPGETLAALGRLYGMPYPWIEAANPGLGDHLPIGQVVTIPSPDELLPLPVVAEKRVVVSIEAQRVWVYEKGQVKWDWPASTGIDSSPTAPGIFQIQSHVDNAYASIWDLWMPNFMGVYRPVPTSDFMNGFHGFPTRDGANLLWTGDLGHKVTYGCVLLSSDNATQLYDWAEEGVVVEIRP